MSIMTLKNSKELEFLDINITRIKLLNSAEVKCRLRQHILFLMMHLNHIFGGGKLSLMQQDKTLQLQKERNGRLLPELFWRR